MSSAVSAPPITIEQYLCFESPEGYRDELINGRIILSPDPKPLHQDVAHNILLLLLAAVGRRYKVRQRTNLRFPGANSMPSPDVFVIGKDAWDQARDADGYPAGSDVLLVVEVVSPGNRGKHLREKADIYLTHGLELWIVHPKRREVKIYRRDETVAAPSIIVLPDALGGASINLADIFKV